MAYVKQTINTGDTITNTWGNLIQTQYDEVAVSLLGNCIFRDLNGYLEYNEAGTGWKAVGGLFSTKYPGSFSTMSTTYVTALSITGIGTLRWLGLYNVTANSDAFVRVTIDGVVVGENRVRITYPRGFNPLMPVGSVFSSANDNATDLSFKTSVLVELHADVGTAWANWVYELL